MRLLALDTVAQPQGMLRAMTIEEILPFLIPLIVLQLALIAAGLYDLTRAERRVRGDNKLVWALVIVFGQMLGPLVYFLFGREDA